jgi:hypothetical protein
MTDADTQARDDEDSKGLLLRGPLGLASAEVECWKCSHSTPVAALTAAGVVDLDFDDGEQEDESGSFVYGIEEHEMPAELVTLLAVAAPQYRPAYSGTRGDVTWSNVCHYCGALQGAFFLHSEPDGPFFGSPADFEGAAQQLMAGDLCVFDANYSI